MLEKFGYAIIPAGEFLFRRFHHQSHEPCMFFAFDPIDTFTYHNSNTQKWQTKRDLKLLVMISDVFDNGHCTSNINEVFALLNPEMNVSEFDDLTIKQCRQKDLRPLFSNQIQKLGYDGWLTSIEGRSSIEAYLCPEDISIAVSFVKAKYSFGSMTSLHRIKLFLPIFIEDKLNKLQSARPIKIHHRRDFNKKLITYKSDYFSIRELYCLEKR